MLRVVREPRMDSNLLECQLLAAPPTKQGV